jgi:hypothetical protein
MNVVGFDYKIGNMDCKCKVLMTKLFKQNNFRLIANDYSGKALYLVNSMIIRSGPIYA